MSWIWKEKRRPLVMVEDHIRHIKDMAAALAESRPAVLDHTWLVCLDRPGPDTDRAVAALLAQHRELMVAARMDGPVLPEADEARLKRLEEADFSDQNRFVRGVAGLLRPGGLLVQDIQLETLGFLPPDRWWESIYLATSVRGLFMRQPPQIRFMSNKSSFSLSFFKKLDELQLGSSDLIDKNDLKTMIGPVVEACLRKPFGALLRACDDSGQLAEHLADIYDETLAEELDVVLYLDAYQPRLGGRVVKKEWVTPNEKETATWKALIQARLDLGAGLPVLDLGERIAVENNLDTEPTSLASRHMLNLRKRLEDKDGIITVANHYRLKESLSVGLVAPSDTFA